MASRLNIGNEAVAQLVRFGVVGLFLAGVYSAIYWYLATYVMPPVAAVVIAFAVSVSIGFVLHRQRSGPACTLQVIGPRPSGLPRWREQFEAAGWRRAL